MYKNTEFIFKHMYGGGQLGRKNIHIKHKKTDTTQHLCLKDNIMSI